MFAWTWEKLILTVAAAAILILLAANGLYSYKNFLSNKEAGPREDVYVRFEMEAYDKIIENYWMKVPEGELAGLFKLAVEKASAGAAELNTQDRAGAEEMLSTVLSNATSTEEKKRLALDTLIVALYNLQPAGRDGILSTKQERAFRENVSNINSESDLYRDIGTQKGATPEEIKESYGKKKAALAKAGTPEAKTELEKADYAYKVLADADSRELYNEAKIEPTLFSRKIGSALYVNMTRISPTTLQEFGRAILSTEGADSMILDMRGNIGGSLDFVQAFLGLFMGQNQYAFDLYAKDEFKPQRTILPKADELKPYKEIAILTDEMTQSSAELLAAAFKRFHLGTIIGKTTRGWGTIENTYALETKIDPNEDYALLLVNHITLRDDNQPIEGRGVEPDVDVSKSEWQRKLASHFRSASLMNAIKEVSGQPPLK